MGRLDVHITHGGGPSLDPKVPVVIAGAVLLASGGGAVVSGVVSTIVSLVIVVFWTIIGIAVAGIVLAIVFRKRIRRNLRPTRVVWASRPELPPVKPAPERDSGPRVVEHRHYHHIVGPTGLYSEMPGWDKLVRAEIVESKDADPGREGR